MRIPVITGVLVVLTTFSHFFEGECVPVRKKLPSKEMENFMKQFGYIKSGPDVADALYTVSGFQNAIRKMQAFGGLPQTGELDPATLNLTRAPRCGVPDILPDDVQPGTRKKRYVLGAKGWKKKSLTYFLANWPPAMDSEVVSQKLSKAFQLWSSVTPLRFEPKESMDADLIVAFGRGPHGDLYPFDGPGNVLAHAYFPYEHGSYGGDVHFDDDEAWVDGATADKRDGGVDFYTVAAHELGHSLGLAHSTVPGSIMFPYYKGYDPYMRLDYDDIVAMYSLYVLDNNFEEEPASSSTSTTPTYADEDENPYDPSVDDDKGTDSGDEDDSGNDTGDYDDDSGDRRDDPDHDDDTVDRRDDPRRDHDDDSSTGDRRDDPVRRDYDDPEKDGDVSPDGGKNQPPVGRDDSDEGGGFEEDEEEDYTDYPDVPATEAAATVGTEAPSNPKEPESTPKTTPSGKFGDICEGSIDAAELLRDELFVFKGTLMWRFKDRDEQFPGYPVDFHLFFSRLPKTIQSIDAVYQRPNDYHIIFFTGKVLWEFEGNHFTPDSPRSLTSLGLPPDLDRLDAAMVWAKNGRTYFFRGDKYWRYDEEKGKMEAGYPQRITRWREVPPGLDTAFTWKDGKTYFFKDDLYWRFNNQNVSIDGNYPLPTASYWFGCHH